MPFDNPPEAIDMRQTLALISARELIRWRWRWGKGRWCSSLPPPWQLCAAQAIHKAEPDITIRIQCLMIVSRLLPEGFLSIPQYNDHPDTTHADILALFDRAIAETAV
jgi:hypothetical protein